MSRPGRQVRSASARASMRPKPHDMRAVGVPLPSAKGGIRVLQGVRSRCTRPAVAPRWTHQSGRGPTDAAARSPRAQWSRRFQRPGAVGFQPTARAVDGSRTRDTQVKNLVLYL
jgi:hypothetical protein